MGFSILTFVCLLFFADMNDELKIQALMIYFSHWGKEELRIQKNLYGARLFQHLIQTDYTNRDENALEVLTDTDKSSFHFWYNIVHTLLPEMNHWVEYYDYSTKPLYHKIKFCENNGVPFQTLFYSGLTLIQMKCLDSIIALPTLKIN